MCGIFGWVASSAPLPEPAFAAAVHTLTHRGPDGVAFWTHPAGRAGLGHTRLAIQDLQFGLQPISSEDGGLHAVVNGELYGFEEIGRELAARGHRIATRCDSEIVVHLYEDWHVGCLERLRGEFAFALWDERRQTLFAARDRFGIKPLYWAPIDGRLVVASEAKAILSAGVAPVWDRTAFLRTLFVCQPPDGTVFAGIHQVPPGHYLLSDGSSTRIVKYWDLDYPPGDGSDDAAAACRLRRALGERLEESTRLRLRADVPVGVFLSGGIDSSTVAGIASNAQAEPLRSFTVSFAGHAFDEAPVARHTAARLRSDHTEIRVTVEDLLRHWEEAVWHGETLAANAHGVARYLQCRAVRRAGCKAVLSGEGADELLAGYSFARRDWDAAALPASPGAAGRADNLASVAARLGFVPGWMRNAATQRVVLYALLVPDLAVETDGLDPYRSLVDEFDIDGQLKGRHPVIQSLYLWSRSVLPGYILLSDRMEMAHGVESRLPYLDHRLFEEVRDCPARLLVSGACGKQILREVAAPYVTPEVARRPKQPFAAPPLATGESEMKHEIRSQIRAGLADQGFFDEAAVLALLDRLDRMKPGSDAPFEPILMLIASTVALQKRYHITSWRA